ncbi:MnmC family methyltransferase [Bdellovibrionota bacterium FG-2]
MKPPEFELVTLKSGIKSLRALDNLETFHPVTGPWIEANELHVEQQRLVDRSANTKGPFVIWDVGLGAAANALAAIEALKNISDSEIEIHSFDKTTRPLEFALQNAAELSYLCGHEETIQLLLASQRVKLAPRITWALHLGDFCSELKDRQIPSPHAIIYDPYSSTGNPEMWSLTHFQSLQQRLNPLIPCMLTNYTRSTAIRVTLLLAGFFVGVGRHIGQKAETTVASNQAELLDQPLDLRWLERVRVSRNAAPLSATASGVSPITPADFERLKNCPQFVVSGKC